MPLLQRWLLPLIASVAFGQEAASYFPEPTDRARFAWELTLWRDQVEDPRTPSASFNRLGAQLRLRWTWEQDGLRLVAGTRSATGTDGNRFNLPRWDQQPSNGTQLDVAHADLSWVTAQTFGTLRLGFQENALVTSQVMWDQDLRFLGAGGIAGVRDLEGLLGEASLRGAAGRVRDILGGDVDLAAVQGVLKTDVGPTSWTLHAGRWGLVWDPGSARLRRLPGGSATARQKLVVDTGGLVGTWHAAFPLAFSWSASRDRATGETSGEAQASAGSRERVYWPHIAYTWQRLSATGSLYPVNGDEWWFYRRARGPRVDLSVPLPGHWLVSLSVIQQRPEGETGLSTRSLLTLTRRF